MIALIAACFALGGSSRPDVIQLALLRPLAVVWTAVLLCFAPAIEWRAVRWPGSLLLALAVIMMLQLIPLPFSWWSALPGRTLAREALELTGQTGIAHSWSLMPDRTLNSLFILSVPAAAIIGMAALDQRDRQRLLPWLLGAIAAHMLLIFLQLLVGSAGRFRPFSTTDMESAVGFFANRNHAAVLLTAALPLIACAASWPLRKPRNRTGLRLALAAATVLILLAVLAIGSRAGLATTVVGLTFAVGVLWPEIARYARATKTPAARWLPVLFMFVVVAALVAIAMLGARDEAIRRLVGLSAYNDIRVQSLPTSIAMMKDVMPFGFGFGTFEPMYRAAEPRSLLHLRYLNHAHNDWIELLIDAGLAGAAVLAVAVGWFVVSAIRAIRLTSGRTETQLARASVGVLLIAAMASVTDYPLRTPVWMLVAAIAAVWLANPIAPPPKTGGLETR